MHPKRKTEAEMRREFSTAQLQRLDMEQMRGFVGLLTVPEVANTLEPAERDVLRLRLQEQRSVREVERLCGISRSNVDRKCYITMLKLLKRAKEVTESWDEGQGQMPASLAEFSGTLFVALSDLDLFDDDAELRELNLKPAARVQFDELRQDDFGNESKP